MLKLVPIDIKDANVFIEQHHRHHKPVQGAKLALAAAIGAEIVGVCTVGRPVARHLDDGWTLEVTRLCSIGARNVCSFLYAAAWRVAQALGYHRLITYILDSEPGTSLKAAGWVNVGTAGGGSWSVPSRPRVDKHPLQQKIRWQKESNT